jgi:hypothetical protein
MTCQRGLFSSLAMLFFLFGFNLDGAFKESFGIFLVLLLKTSSSRKRNP